VPQPRLLWLDCTTGRHDPTLRMECGTFFEVTVRNLHERAGEDIDRLRPRVLCFDFDYPEPDALAAMQTLKRQYPGLPALMLTVEHSEALAVWAFRARIWNFLVKPVDLTEWRDNLHALIQIASYERRGARTAARPEPAALQEIPSNRPGKASRKLHTAIYYIEQHFRERCGANEIAQLCGMSKFSFSRNFRSTFGLTFQDYLLRYRVGEACRLLQRPTVSVTEVGCTVGFNDPSHFARMFRKYTGVLPSEYMRRAGLNALESRPHQVGPEDLGARHDADAGAAAK
jgi:AraC-like DNA-binding protein